MDINKYKIIINNRNYTDYSIYKYPLLVETQLDICPIKYKLFNNDIFIYENNNIFIIESPIRNMNSIPAVVILKDNKTYGKYKNGKLLYKCIPNDISLPIFLVSYENKNMSSFNKNYLNIYVIIKYVEWDKYLIGSITNNIGYVNILDNYYEYQLCCKELNISMNNFNKYLSKQLKKDTDNYYINNICDTYKNIQNRSNWSIFSIDNISTNDYDDAISIQFKDDSYYLLSIYISNVSIWLDIFNLWDIITDRVSSIYLPNKVIHMLPNLLSTGLCSLKSNINRIAFVIDIKIDKEYNIIDIEWNNCIIKVYKNYYYEESDLLKDNNYIMLFDITKKLNEKYSYGINITNSSDIIAYNMILMNYYSSKKLLEYNNGIFRSIIINDIDTSLSNTTIPLSILNFVKIYNSNNSSKYININNNKENIAHNILKLDSYIHITSPIRRLPDILNMIKLQQNLNMIKFKNNVDIFYEKWIDNIDYINKSMKNIKKIQNECYLLYYCSNNNDILQNVYDGYIIDKHIEKGKINNIIIYKYLVYINILNIVMSIKLNNRSLNLYDINKYQLYIFNDEDKFKKKIRLNIVN